MHVSIGEQLVVASVSARYPVVAGIGFGPPLVARSDRDDLGD